METASHFIRSLYFCLFREEMGNHIVSLFSLSQSIMDRIWGKWAWLQQEFYGVAPNGTTGRSPEDQHDAEKLIAIVALEEELDDFQPLYRSPLIQRLYSFDGECTLSDDDDAIKRLRAKMT